MPACLPACFHRGERPSGGDSVIERLLYSPDNLFRGQRRRYFGKSCGIYDLLEGGTVWSASPGEAVWIGREGNSIRHARDKAEFS